MLLDPWRIEMLGGLRAQAADRTIDRFRTRQVASLLAFLAFYPDRPHSRDALAEMLWPDAQPEIARRNLRQALFYLRRHLTPLELPEETILKSDFAGIRLTPDGVETDVSEFVELLRRAFDESAEGATELLIAATDLYKGPLLPELDDAWIEPERQSLRDAYLGAIRRLVRSLADGREYDRAIEYAHRAVREDRYREESHRSLIRLYLAAGRPAAAALQFDELKAALDEIGAAPSAASVELELQIAKAPAEIKKPDHASSVPAQPRDIAVEKVSGRRNLPIPRRFNRFFGREQETDLLRGLLEQPATRLVTLTGPGGTGKTRLSLEAAQGQTDLFPDGIWFAPLADIRNPSLIPDAIRKTLDIAPSPSLDQLDQSIHFLSGKRGLLILDNYEQLSPRGNDVILTLISRTAQAAILVTSRRRLNLEGERELPVHPLPTPQPLPNIGDMELSDLRRIPSVALFVDRAQTARPDFALTGTNGAEVASLCAKLDGLPLALELAAARIRGFTPAQLLANITERFELLATRKAEKSHRHRSLWGAIDWSYELLPKDLQRFFARLSVFRGGWSVEAASQVAGDAYIERDAFENRKSKIENEALEALDRLRSHSLVHQEDSELGIRFRMLETIREFAWQQLCTSDAATTRSRHAEWFAKLAEEAIPDLVTGHGARWFKRIEVEYANLLSGAQWGLEREGDPVVGYRMSTALSFYWQVCGGREYGRKLLTAVLSKTLPEEFAAYRARALSACGSLAMLLGENEQAVALMTESVDLYTRLGNHGAAARTRTNMGITLAAMGRLDKAEECYQLSLDQFREAGDRNGIAGIVNNIGRIRLALGDAISAKALFDEALAINQETGNSMYAAINLGNIGESLFAMGRPDEAHSWFSRSLEMHRTLNDVSGMADTLESLAKTELLRRNLPGARAYLKEGRDCYYRSGKKAPPLVVLTACASLAICEGSAEQAAVFLSAVDEFDRNPETACTPIEKAYVEEVRSQLRALPETKAAGAKLRAVHPVDWRALLDTFLGT